MPFSKSANFRRTAFAALSSITVLAGANMANAVEPRVMSQAECTAAKGFTAQVFTLPQYKGKLSPEFVRPWGAFIKNGCVGPVEIPTPTLADATALTTISIALSAIGIDLNRYITAPAPAVVSPPSFTPN